MNLEMLNKIFLALASFTPLLVTAQRKTQAPVKFRPIRMNQIPIRQDFETARNWILNELIEPTITRDPVSACGKRSQGCTVFLLLKFDQKKFIMSNRR